MGHLYNLESWVSLYIAGIVIYVDTLREFYEAFVIYVMSLLMNFLKAQYPNREAIL